MRPFHKALLSAFATAAVFATLFFCYANLANQQNRIAVRARIINGDFVHPESYRRLFGDEFDSIMVAREQRRIRIDSAYTAFPDSAP